MLGGLSHVGSIIFGIVAWALPIINLKQKDAYSLKKTILMIIFSLLSCMIALYLQLLFKNYLVVIGDWAALDDTVYVFEIAAGILLVGTIGLNFWSLSSIRLDK
jgi:cytochrome c oxidase subunit 4